MRRMRKQLFVYPAVLLLCLAPLRVWGGEAGSDEKKPAVVVVRLPADAELVIGGVTSKQQTAVREFDTPPLPSGQKFSYVLKAAWKDGDKEVTHVRTIFVQSGETTEVDLVGAKLSPPSAAKIPAPELTPETKTAAKPKSEKTPKPQPMPEKKPEPAKQPEKPETKPQSEKKPEETEKKTEKPAKPELKPEPEKKPEPRPKPEKKPEPEKKAEPKPKPPTAPGETPSVPPTPSGTLSLVLPETLNLQPGGSKLLPIKVVRTHCEGPVRITFEGVPAGVELKNALIAANKQKVYVQAAVPAAAEEKEWEVKVIGSSGSVHQETTLKIKIAR